MDDHGERWTVSVRCDDIEAEALLAGFSEFGLAGLTAVDYLVETLGLEQCGHVAVSGIPTITPFEDGRPRHPIRLFTGPDVDVAVLVVESLIPAPVADSFARAIREWTEGVGIGEIAVLSGIPIQHAPDDHRTFFVATDDYRRDRLADGDLDALGMGFLDGVRGSLLAAGIDTPLRACVFVTPAHAQAPDVEAALRLVGTADAVYGVDVDTGPLEAFASEIEAHYEELAERLAEAEDEMLPEDRMYM